MATAPRPVISADPPITPVQPVPTLGGAFSDRFGQSRLGWLFSTRVKVKHAPCHGRRAKSVDQVTLDVLFQNGAPSVTTTDPAEGMMCGKRREVDYDRRDAAKFHRKK